MPNLQARVVIKCAVITLIFLVVSGCSIQSDNTDAKMRSPSENMQITNSWYPIKSQECKMILDSFALVTVALGSNEEEYLITHIDEIKKNLESAGKVTSTALLNLAQTTSEPSIREYALEAVPILAQMGSLVNTERVDASVQINILNKLVQLTERVPDACKS